VVREAASPDDIKQILERPGVLYMHDDVFGE